MCVLVARLLTGLCTGLLLLLAASLLSTLESLASGSGAELGARGATDNKRAQLIHCEQIISITIDWRRPPRITMLEHIRTDRTRREPALRAGPMTTSVAREPATIIIEVSPPQTQSHSNRTALALGPYQHQRFATTFVWSNVDDGCGFWLWLSGGGGDDDDGRIDNAPRNRLPLCDTENNNKSR